MEASTPHGPLDHEHGPGHSHKGHSHDHSHDHSHEDGHSHDHSHDHSHEHEDGHSHAHEHGHSHDHSHEDEHSHSHEDGHSHSHEHGHSHSHEHESALERVTLPRGAGVGKVLFFDANSGLAGDMIVASLIDLGVPLQVVQEAAAAVLGAPAFHLHIGYALKHAIAGTLFDVHEEGSQPARNYRTIRGLIEASALAEDVKSLALRIFARLAEAESHAHRVPLEEVHFHEVGGVDAIVDIVGAAAALTYVGAELVMCSPLPMGRGFIRAAHGMLPNPPPAVLHCLRGVPTVPANLELELVTPTGAAIIATVATSFEAWPSISPLQIGVGAGHRDLADRPNLLRAVLGEAPLVRRNLIELASNIDDMTPELAAFVVEALLAAGARDAWLTSALMKKGRPGQILHVLCDREHEAVVTSTLLRESTTLGVRRTEVSRAERPRRIVSVETRFGSIEVKVAEGPFGPAHAKPEFDQCRKLAAEHGAPVREVLAAALEAFLGTR